ncbi:hypothetical protein M9Y10_029652 [Tritrichomonas musculus]|uniref:Initiator binding domain-containing protein n=1 Tax=Tritrichomonas musculus TaxID=1915356 RepID=A0ABR2KMQ9_9EUKA
MITNFCINGLINCEINRVYQCNNKISPIEIKTTPNDSELLAIIANQQKKIIINRETREKIMEQINPQNLNKWYDILEPKQIYYNNIMTSVRETIPNELIAKFSVITYKELTLCDFVSFLDSQFGQSLFPEFTFEDAAVILFIKPQLPNWLYRLITPYSNEISRYIKCMSFALKIIIEKIEGDKIDPFVNKKNYITYSASQNILLYLNETYTYFIYIYIYTILEKQFFL